MQNTLYKYSKSLGMIERNYTDVKDPEEWSDTKDQAYITYYLCELAVAHNQHAELASKAKALDEHIKNLDNTFGYLKEKYPEEFL